MPFTDNFDASCTEPSVLPARLPQLLINGSQGIAVGIATKIPPHNLREVATAFTAYVSNPSISDEDLLTIVPGPDFPTGALLLPGPGIAGAYATGKGGMMVRSKVHVESSGAHGTRSTLVVTELPYQVPKAAVIEEIAALVEKGTLGGISDIQDESDRDGMRIAIEVKRGSDPDVVLNNLFKHSRLQTRFSANMVALVEGGPEVMTLRRMLQTFSKFRFQVCKAQGVQHGEDGCSGNGLSIGHTRLLRASSSDLSSGLCIWVYVTAIGNASRAIRAGCMHLQSDLRTSSVAADSPTYRRGTSLQWDVVRRRLCRREPRRHWHSSRRACTSWRALH